MYSPKIDEDLIPYIFHLARFLRLPMTKTVSKILREVIENLKEKGCYEVFEKVAKQQEAEKLLADHFKQLFGQTLSESSIIIHLPRGQIEKTQGPIKRLPGS